MISPFGTVWTTPSRSRRVVRRRVKSSTVPATPAIRTTSPLANWFSIRISDAVEVVADEALGAEADGDPDDAEPGDRRPDVEPELAEDHQPGDRRR